VDHLEDHMELLLHQQMMVMVHLLQLMMVMVPLHQPMMVMVLLHQPMMVMVPLHQLMMVMVLLHQLMMVMVPQLQQLLPVMVPQLHHKILAHHLMAGFAEPLAVKKEDHQEDHMELQLIHALQVHHHMEPMTKVVDLHYPILEQF